MRTLTISMFRVPVQQFCFSLDSRKYPTNGSPPPFYGHSWLMLVVGVTFGIRTMTIFLAAVLLSLGVINVASPQDFPSQICITWLSLSCLGEDRALTNTGVGLTYNYGESNLTRFLEGGLFFTKNTASTTIYNLSYEDIGNNERTREANYFFEQLQHGGGDCNCVDIYFNCIIDDTYRYESHIIC